MNGLVVFDVDGTLIETLEIDEASWQVAGREVLGLKKISTEWGIYEHSTDEAVVSQLVREQTNLSVEDGIIHRFRDRIHELLRAAVNESRCIEPKSGAQALFSALGDAGWAAAIATGGWEVNARFKLQQAGLCMDGIPAAFAEDAWPREELIRLAQERASQQYGVHFNSIVYVGDGVWDMIAACLAGAGFIGIGTGEKKSLLQKGGALVVLPDFSDSGVFIDAVERVSRAISAG